MVSVFTVLAGGALAVALVVSLIVGLMAAGRGGTPERFCTTCGHQGPGRNHTRGSFAVEIVLWLLFIVPGLIYSLWRLSTRRPVCALCGATTLVPPNSPVAQRERRRLALDAAAEPAALPSVQPDGPPPR